GRFRRVIIVLDLLVVGGHFFRLFLGQHGFADIDHMLFRLAVVRNDIQVFVPMVKRHSHLIIPLVDQGHLLVGFGLLGIGREDQQIFLPGIGPIPDALIVIGHLVVRLDILGVQIGRGFVLL